jgi:hypothetical protein
MDSLMNAIVTNLTLPRLLFWEIGGIGLVMIILQIWTLRRTKIMGQDLDDLRSAIGDLGSAISRETADITAVLDQMTGSIHPADLKDFTAAIRASVNNINDASTKLEAAVAPTPPADSEGGQTSGPGAPEPPPPGGEGGQTTGPGKSEQGDGE